MTCNAPAAVVCLTGVSSGARAIEIDAATLNRRMVLENDVVFGSVNANARHYRLAVDALTQAEAGWLDGLLPRVPLDRWHEAFEHQPHDVKVLIELGDPT